MLADTADDWLEQSKQEGRKEGKLTFLINLLEERFGSLNTETKATLHSLNETKLLECAKRLFTAKTLQDVIKQ
jgi:hypothetical protein